MKKWYITFKESSEKNVETIVAERGDLGPEAFKRFDAVAKKGKYQGRKILGMWILDHGSEQEDVLKHYGQIPAGYQLRHENWKKRQN